MVNSTELLSDWLMGYPGSTSDGYRRDVEQFALWLQGERGREILEADRADVQRWLAHIRDELGFKDSTVQRKTSAVASFYTYCVQERILEHNPCEHVRRPRGDSAPKLGLPLDDARKLLAVAEERSPSAHALIWMMCGAGLRVAEACRARIEDVAGGYLTVKVKGGHTQLKPLSAPVLEAVEAAAGDRTEGEIVRSTMGRPLSRRTALRLVDELTAAAGIDDCTPHTLRHTTATTALASGARLEDVSQLLGHKNLETTLRYVQNRDVMGGMRAAADRVGAALTGSGT